MNLTTAQKIGIGFVALVGLMVLWSLYAWWAGWHDQLDKAIAKQTKINADLTKVEQKAQQAKVRIAALRDRSLPADQENARRLYQGWLSSQFEQAGFRDIKVAPGAASEYEKLYQTLGFKVSGHANLKQMTELLHRFYSVNLLHRIQRISLVPVPDSKELDIDVTAEAIMFLDAPRADQLQLEKSDRLQQGDLAAYWTAILNRNLLGPANHPPTLARIDAQKVRRGDAFSLTAKASDPDGLDKLQFALEKSPEGAKIDPATGKVTWRPPGNGNYELTIRVEDDGWPMKASSQKVVVAVIDPPPPQPMRVVGPPPEPKPRWDLGKFTFVTGVTEADGRPEAWFVVRNTGESLRLRVGDRFDAGGLKGTVAGFADEVVEIEVLGKRYSVRLGDNLSQAVEVRRVPEARSIPESATTVPPG